MQGQQNVKKQNVCLIFSTICAWNGSHYRNNQGSYHQSAWVFKQSTRYSCQILMKLEFSRQIFEKNFQIWNFMKIRPVGAELFHADGQTDMTKLIVAFRYFANAPKNFAGASCLVRSDVVKVFILWCGQKALFYGYAYIMYYMHGICMHNTALYTHI
jgi:hypothetical protein